MALYRQIHTSIWKDEWFLDLEPDDKLLFIYLFSNDNTSVSGIYKVALKVIAFETCLPMPQVKAALKRFADARKVYYQDGVVWVKNLRKYNESSSETVAKRIAADVADIPEGQVKRMYTAFYSGNTDGYPSDTLAIPYVEPAPERERERERETETEREQERDGDGANAPRRRKRREPVPPAVAVMRSEMQRYPARATYQEIADAVGEDQAALDEWRELCRQWVRRGYNAGNVEGLLGAWNAGGLAPRKGGGSHTDAPQVTLTGTDSGFAYGEIERIQEQMAREREAATT